MPNRSAPGRSAAALRRRWGIGLLPVALIAAIAAMMLQNAVRQDPAYHNFADNRSLLGIANFGNVASNLPFAVVGVLALGWLAVQKQLALGLGSAFHVIAFTIFFLGVLLTAFGSAYYHLAPSNQRLLWDRLPMSVAFMSLFAMVVGERIARPLGALLLGPLLALGAASVILWYRGELNGAGDLRWYLLVQFYPVFAIPLMCWLFSPLYTRTSDLFVAISLYVLAKILEDADRSVYSMGTLVSGHTLKHLAAAAATFCLLRMFQLRQPLRLNPALPEPAAFYDASAVKPSDRS